MIQFQRATVLGFTRAENTPPVVPTNIFVSNARGLTPLQNVTLQTKKGLNPFTIGGPFLRPLRKHGCNTRGHFSGQEITEHLTL